MGTTRVGLLAAGVLVSSLLLPPAPARAAETYVCWQTSRSEGPGVTARVIRCRIAGREIRDFGGGTNPPAWLVPAVGSDIAGTCWYRRSWWSGWSLAALYPDGTARLRYDPDGRPGGPVLADAIVPPCRREPEDAPPDIEYAWRVLRSMTLRSEALQTSPPEPVTGLPTYLPVVPAARQLGAVVSPVSGNRIEVEAAPGEITVDWGDGSSETVAADKQALGHFRPSTSLSHSYQTAAGLELVVQWTWDVRWRVNNATWQPLRLEPIEARLWLVVDEIVSRLS